MTDLHLSLSVIISLVADGAYTTSRFFHTHAQLLTFVFIQNSLLHTHTQSLTFVLNSLFTSHAELAAFLLLLPSKPLEASIANRTVEFLAGKRNASCAAIETRGLSVPYDL